MNNATLKNLIKLSSKVEIYVPSTFGVNKKSNNTKQVNATLNFLSETFGGATATDALGCWKSETGELVKEKVKICYSNCTTDQLENNIEEIVTYCENLKTEMKQEAISLAVNGELYFI